jgi:predicted RNase H-related nuclease YkuK (DUF458 family)
MSDFKSLFKKFGGDHIPDIIEYLKDCIERDPTVTITVGCDSIQKRKRTIYAITIMLYNTDIRKGAHVVFFRESCPKIRENQERLYKEAQWVHDVATYLDIELSSFYTRKDLTDVERKRYKYYLAVCNGEYANVQLHQEQNVINAMHLTPADLMDYKLVDIHVDFNPFEGTVNERGVSKNKSYVAYKSFTPWLRGLGFRTWGKPMAWGASTAADLLLQD